MHRPDIGSIKRRVEQATASPWLTEVERPGYRHPTIITTTNGKPLYKACYNFGSNTQTGKNTVFVANARQDIEDLINYVKHLEDTDSKEKECSQAYDEGYEHGYQIGYANAERTCR